MDYRSGQQMARGRVTFGDVNQKRFLVDATLVGVWAARSEATPRWRIDGAGNIPFQDDLPFLLVRPRHRYR